jgi:hypothetical protein
MPTAGLRKAPVLRTAAFIQGARLESEAGQRHQATPKRVNAHAISDLGTGNGEVDRSTLFHARSDDVVPLAVKLFALDLQFSQFLL